MLFELIRSLVRKTKYVDRSKQIRLNSGFTYKNLSLFLIIKQIAFKLKRAASAFFKLFQTIYAQAQHIDVVYLLDIAKI